ncbi:unnamed protein product [Rhizophagus irregularis]|nr:unnamed protein product [Rhizophagus irregularis]
MAQQSHFIYKNDQSNYKAARNGNRLNELTGSAFQSSIFTNISENQQEPNSGFNLNITVIDNGIQNYVRSMGLF